MEHEVQQDKQQGKDSYNKTHKRVERGSRTTIRYGHGYRDNLRANNFIELPTKAMGCAVEFDHSLGGDLRRAVTSQTFLFLNFNRTGVI